MTKYNEEFKRGVVDRYLAGSAGYAEVGNQFGIDDTLVRRWVRLFRSHGVDGLKKKFSHYSAEFKLSVLSYLREHSLSYFQASTLFNIRSAGAVGTWQRRYDQGGLDALASQPRGRPKKMPDSAPKKPPLVPDDLARSREDLLAELSYLRMENAYLKKLKALVRAQQQPTPPKKLK